MPGTARCDTNVQNALNGLLVDGNNLTPKPEKFQKILLTVERNDSYPQVSEVLRYSQRNPTTTFRTTPMTKQQDKKEGTKCFVLSDSHQLD